MTYKCLVGKEPTLCNVDGEAAAQYNCRCTNLLLATPISNAGNTSNYFHLIKLIFMALQPFEPGFEAALFYAGQNDNTHFDIDSNWQPLMPILKEEFGDPQHGLYILDAALKGKNGEWPRFLFDMGFFTIAKFSLSHSATGYNKPVELVLASKEGEKFLRELFSYVNN